MATRLPATYQKLSVLKISNKFNDAVKLVTNPLPSPGPGEVLVKNRWVTGCTHHMHLIGQVLGSWYIFN